jgi:regulator of cell morphogenesis and NO signaling
MRRLALCPSTENTVTDDATIFDATCTVNELISREPRTIAVFNRFGIDTCCGSQVAIGEAARRDGVDRGQLLAELHRVMDRP